MAKGRFSAAILRPLNPANQPDPWERVGLLSFGQGSREATAFAQLDGSESFRLRRPFLAEPACLECHAAQGYRVGDLRGAISIGIPMAPSGLSNEREGRRKRLAAWHAGLWFLGLLVTWGSWRNLSREARAREAAEAQREVLVGELRAGLEKSVACRPSSARFL